MADELKGKKIAFLAADMVEQVELTEPWKALEQAGAELELLSIKDGEIQAFNHYDKADTFKVDRTVEEADPSEYDGLVLPGGVGNPDTLRQDENAVEFARAFFQQGKPVGAICHAPWLLVEAGVVRERKLTSFPSVQTDIRNAGGNWVDEEVVSTTVSSRAAGPTTCRRSTRSWSRSSRRVATRRRLRRRSTR
jgi:protease I